MARKRKKYENPVQRYKGYFICRVGEQWRIKDDPGRNYALHYGSFSSVVEAKKFIDQGWIING